jgi:hypothetical protein
MNDMSAAIIPRSDQKNADDFLAGPMTITITGVTIRGGQEQPVSINFDGDEGKPYKPCKSMSRMLVYAWGPDAKQYIGRSMTLYCDPSVRWAGMEVGGIRISHLSHIDGPITKNLTVTKGNKKPYTVRPLEVAAQEPAIDWNTEILGCQTVDELRELVDGKMDEATQQQHKKLIVARKKELTPKVPE